jgi:tRNA (cmo5U34)-methyltransferase
MDRLEKIPNNWTFKNKEVAQTFNNHVREHLPWYDMVTFGVSCIAKNYLPVGGVVYDIGASTGNISNALKETVEHRSAKIYNIEPSIEMISCFNGIGDIITSEAQDVNYKEFDVAVLFLTMMFVPVKERASLFKKLYTLCNAGGCIIIVDKVEAVEGYIGTVFSRLTLENKKKSNVPSAEILDKELSLSGEQRPLDISLLPPHAKTWFKFGDFTGYIVEKRTDIK